MTKKRPRTITTTLETDGARLQTIRQEDSDGESMSEADDAKSETLFQMDTPVTIEEIREKYVQPKEECWGCIHRFGPQRRPGKNKNLDALWAEYTLNKDDMSQEEVAKLIAKAHEKYVYKPEIEAGKSCLFWSISMVLRHLAHHMTDVKSIMMNSIQRYELIEKEISQSVFVKRGDAVDHHPLKLKGMEMMGKLKLAYIEKLKNM
jgi:hypothetical protein